MKASPNIVAVASLIGDPSRAAMLMNLLGGKALPASELARAARIKPQTASSHLSKLVNGGLLVQESYGRHRYYRLANAEAAEALETLNAIAPEKPIQSLRESYEAKALHFARTCYDHVAGELGVALTDKMLELGLVVEVGKDFQVTARGADRIEAFGIDLKEVKKTRRHFARRCLDWSERRHHMAGALGAAIANRMFELGWIARVPAGRALRVTDEGYAGLESELEIHLTQKRSNG
ncbi:helix-turn-helix transcriptional regulator [Alicyclobacillus sp. SO9]|uniref:ArsR/SmtB family transcription factor n=1 Tax=Alicyclobacillus sp. SO9 TaxID=2665646 RepID=UPI0018E74546|nr:winged helix-turn-helix domain-containing protein [Alicyclobacillus sp. SO9]QQE79805.1 winged helix-turn-helix transcriptional regulator [Alicyclobacillus sp. SO9]